MLKVLKCQYCNKSVPINGKGFRRMIRCPRCLSLLKINVHGKRNPNERDSFDGDENDEDFYDSDECILSLESLRKKKEVEKVHWLKRKVPFWIPVSIITIAVGVIITLCLLTKVSSDQFEKELKRSKDVSEDLIKARKMQFERQMERIGN